MHKAILLFPLLEAYFFEPFAEQAFSAPQVYACCCNRHNILVSCASGVLSGLIVLDVLLLRQFHWQDLSRAHRPAPSGQLRQLQQRLRVPLWEQSLRNIASMLPTKHFALSVTLQV